MRRLVSIAALFLNIGVAPLAVAKASPMYRRSPIS